MNMYIYKKINDIFLTINKSTATIDLKNIIIH